MNKEDQELKKLEKRLAREYRQAYSDIAKKCDKYFAKFEEQDKKKKATLSHDDYIKWRQNKMLTGKRWTALRDSLAKDYTNVNQIAARMIREDNIGVMTEAFNHGTYEVEKISGIDTNFTIYNRDSVENIIKNEPDLLPVDPDIPKDLRWNKSKVNSAITQGILQGKPIKEVAKNLESVTDMIKNAAIRNARTMNTYARNVGRLKSYERADKLGVKTRKMWLATLDGRTRHSHRMMDREIVNLDEEFSNKLMEPGDPDGAGGEIYNCRCRMIGVPQGVNPNIFTDDRVSAYLDDNGMSYEEWKKAREPKKKKENERITVNDLSEDLQKVLYNYTNGDYNHLCEYSQYIVNGGADISPSMFASSKDWWEKNKLPDITKKEKEDAETLLKTIINQPVSDEHLVRIERGLKNVDVGDSMSFGLRSTSANTNLIDEIIDDKVEGLEYDLLGKANNGDWVEYKFINSKNLDVSSISAYKEQNERIIAGNYKVVSVEKVKPIKQGSISKDIKVSDMAENVTPFTSKSGKDMIRYNYNGKEMTDTVEKFNSRTDTIYEYQKGVWGRTIITLEVE